MTPTIIANYKRLIEAQRKGIHVLNFTAAGWWVGREAEVGGFYVVRPDGRSCTCGEQGVCQHRLVAGWHDATEAERSAFLAKVDAALSAAA